MAIVTNLGGGGFVDTGAAVRGTTQQLIQQQGLSAQQLNQRRAEMQNYLKMLPELGQQMGYAPNEMNQFLASQEMGIKNALAILGVSDVEGTFQGMVRAQTEGQQMAGIGADYRKAKLAELNAEADHRGLQGTERQQFMLSGAPGEQVTVQEAVPEQTITKIVGGQNSDTIAQGLTETGINVNNFSGVIALRNALIAEDNFNKLSPEDQEVVRQLSEDITGKRINLNTNPTQLDPLLAIYNKYSKGVSTAQSDSFTEPDIYSVDVSQFPRAVQAFAADARSSEPQENAEVMSLAQRALAGKTDQEKADILNALAPVIENTPRNAAEEAAQSSARAQAWLILNEQTPGQENVVATQQTGPQISPVTTGGQEVTQVTPAQGAITQTQGAVQGFAPAYEQFTRSAPAYRQQEQLAPGTIAADESLANQRYQNAMIDAMVQKGDNELAGIYAELQTAFINRDTELQSKALENYYTAQEKALESNLANVRTDGQRQSIITAYAQQIADDMRVFGVRVNEQTTDEALGIEDLNGFQRWLRGLRDSGSGFIGGAATGGSGLGYGQGLQQQQSSGDLLTGALSQLNP